MANKTSAWKMVMRLCVTRVAVIESGTNKLTSLYNYLQLDDWAGTLATTSRQENIANHLTFPVKSPALY
jgi:hypothetical protein